MSASEFAAWVLAHFEQDVWFTASTLSRRLAGIAGARLTGQRLLAALLNAGWLTPHQTYPDTYCLASKCWLSEKPKAAKDATPSGFQPSAQS